MRWGVILILLNSIIYSPSVSGQSVPISDGKWVKIAVSKQGVFQVSGAQLKAWGFSVPFPSNQLKLYNLNTSNLSEKVTSNFTSGFIENFIDVLDGGDGQFDSQDNFLFYSEGQIQWKWNSAAQLFEHSKNLYGDSVYYFITLGKDGKRIQKNSSTVIPNMTTDEYDERVVFEKDSINILNSGKLWLGVPMGVGIGKQTKISYTLNLEGIQNQIKFKINYAAATTISAANFELSLNDQKIRTSAVLPTSGYIYDDAANTITDTFRFPLSGSLTTANISVNYFNNNANSTGWIDFIELQGKRKISYWGTKAFGFRNSGAVRAGNIIQYTVNDADATTKIWDVTNPEQPIEMITTIQNGKASFSQMADTLHEFFSVKQSAYETPIVSEILNIDYPSLLNTPATDYLIITATSYSKVADSLAKFHTIQNGFKTFTTTSAKIFNEFSGGQNSPIGIRNYIKYVIDKAIKNNIAPPKYLLLLGIGNFDYKKINNAFQIPTYESDASLSILSSFTSDDFYSILTDGDDINFPSNIKKLSLSVGRIPARNIAEADSAIQKIVNYQKGKNWGSWRNQLTWVADDGDLNLHLQHAEEIVGSLKAKQPNWNHKKIYLDLFQATNSAAGNTYPLVNNSIRQTINNGSLILNYTGHGNYTRLAEEAVITQEEIQQWDNADKLPLMITASCDFAPYDQPQLQPIGIDAFLKNKKGIIGLVAASRLVFAYINKEINDEYIQNLLVPDSAGNYSSIGYALQNAKMTHWKKGGDHLNAFKFSLIGDPALRLAKPRHQVAIETINQKRFTGKDTLSAGARYQLTGAVLSKGLLLPDFNGIMEFTLFDAPLQAKTLANSSASNIVNVEMQENILFKGKATVSKGIFAIDFILPKEVKVGKGACRMQFYTSNQKGEEDALSVYDSLFVNNVNTFISLDTLGPLFEHVYVNDTINDFKEGAWIPSNSILYLKLKDSAGIQTSGNSLGHDLSLVIDGKTQNPIYLNNYFTADVDTYQKGTVQYTLPTLLPGPHQLVMRAWDLIGNSNRDTIQVVVPNSQNLVVKNLTNYPNPVINYTRFSFELSQLNDQNEPFTYTIDIYNSIGIKVLTRVYHQTLLTNRVVVADFESVATLVPGTYFYNLLVKSANKTAFTSNKFIKY